MPRVGGGDNGRPPIPPSRPEFLKAKAGLTDPQAFSRNAGFHPKILSQNVLKVFYIRCKFLVKTG